MSYKISPLLEGKPTAKKGHLLWLWTLIAIETVVSGYWIFRLHQKIDYLKSQLNIQEIGRNHV